MSVMLNVLLWLFGILTLLAVLGHGVWLMAAAFFRWISGRPRSEPPSFAKVTIQRDPPPPPEVLLRRQLERLRIHNMIGEETYKEVLQALQRYAEGARSAPPRGEVTTVHSPAEPSPGPRPASVVPPVAHPPQTAPPAPRPPEDLPVPAPEPPVRAPAPRERVERYRQRRQQAAQEVPVASLDVAAVPPPIRQMPWGRLLAAFLEEKNIRWGELVGGLLIVSCSIALVVSFWSAIAERPFLKFGVLNGVTASLFAFGLYAARRWKLPTTSQGILLTSTLLVPLNSLAIAAFSEASPQITLPLLAGELFSVSLFSALVYLAAKLICPDWPRSLTLGVIVPCVCQLTMRRYVGESTSISLLYAFCLVGLLTSAAANGVGLRAMMAAVSIEERRGNELLKRLGLIAFSLLVALGLLLVKSAHLRETLQWLSPLSILATLPALSCGIALWLRPGAALPVHRMAGAGLLASAVLTLFGGFILAWPQPALVTGLCVSCFLLLIVLAIVSRVAVVHTLAFLLLTPAVVIAVGVFAGRLDWTESHAATVIARLSSGLTGRTLTGFALVGFAVAQCAAWWRRRELTWAYTWASVVDAALGLMIVCIYGFGRAGDPEYVTWILGAYTVIVVVVAIRARSQVAMATAGALSLGALIQGLVYGDHAWLLIDARLTVPMLHALLLVAFAGGLAFYRAELRTVLYPPVGLWIRVASAACVLLIFVKLAEGTPSPEWFGVLLLTWLGLAVTWSGLAWLESSSRWFAVSQVAVVAAGMTWIDTRVQQQPWFGQTGFARLYPQSLQGHAIWLTAFALGWMVLQGWLGSASSPDAPESTLSFRHKLKRLSATPGVRVDIVAGVAALTLLIGLAVYAVVPGVAQELSPREYSTRVVPAVDAFLWRGIPHGAAHAWPTWLLGGLLATLCLGYLRSHEPSVPMLGLACVSAVVPLLLATRWEPVIAVASALRWYSALYLLLASVFIWMAQPLGQGAQRWGLVRSGVIVKNRVAAFFTLTFVSLAPIIGMALFVAVMALSIQAPRPADWQAIYWTTIIGLAGAVVLLMGFGVSRNQRLPAAIWAMPTAASVFVLAVAPLFAVTLFVIGSALAQHPVIGPDPAAWFSRMGLAASYAIPLTLTSVAVVGHAIYCRSHRIAFAGGLLLNASTTAAYLLTLKSGTLAADQWIQLSQINAMIASLYGLGWNLAARHLPPRVVRQGNAGEPGTAGAEGVAGAPRPAGTVLIWIQRGIASGFALLPIVAAMLVLLVNAAVPLVVAQAGGLWGWLGLLALVVFWWDVAEAELATHRLQFRVWSVTVALIMVALNAQSWSVRGISGQALSLHAMQMVLFISAAMVAIFERWGRWDWQADWPDGQSPAGTGLRFGGSGMLPLCGLILYTATVAVQRLGGLRGETAWIVSGFTAAGLLATERGWLRGRQRLWFLAALLLNVAASFWWADYGALLVCGRRLRGAEEFVCGNLLVLAGLVPVWVALGRRRARPGRGGPTIQGAATGLAIVLLVGLCLSGMSTTSDLTHPFFAWGALLTTAVACFSTLWDPRLKWSGIACYLVSLLAVGTLLDRLNLPTSQLLWSGTLMLSVHGVLTSYVWSRRAGVFAALARVGVSRAEDVRDISSVGIVMLNSILASFICLLGAMVQLSEWNPALRLAVSQAVGAQALAVGLLAHGRRATSLRYYALVVGAFAVVLLSWSRLDPNASGLNRAVVTACALLCVAAFYAVGLIKIVRRENDWTEAASRLVPPLVVISASAVFGVLIAEIRYFLTQGHVPIAWPAVLAVALALSASAVACLIAAIVPGRDPLGLNERQRMGYVYAAEVLLAIMLAHLRVCVPQLFGGVVQRYWTLIVMGLAFLGVGLSEFFRRRRREVLAVPLERTGAILPLLPIIGFWVGPGDVHLSLSMLSAGGVYAALSVMRRSFGFGVLAALAANGGLWYFLQTTAGIQFFAHPQLWLIPPAICVLAAAYLNRELLDEGQMTSIRYLTSAVIYTSSTADIFVNGVAEAPWLPFVLAGLSLTGIFAGILLQVRAFLFLGLAFLGISLFTVIWHAAVDLQQTWLWYVAGIVTGVMIIALFAVFERKRNDVLRVVEQLKTWQR